MFYKHLISLGYNCGCAYQIRLHTGNTSAMFFDWLYTSSEAATHLIKSDFRDFLARDRLQIIRDGTEVLVRPSGIRLNHSFKTEDGKVSPDLIESGFESERAKFDHLAGKMRMVFDSCDSIAFFRYNPTLNVPDNLSKLLELNEQIGARLRRSNFHLFWVVNSGQKKIVTLDGGVTRVDLAEDPSNSRSYRGKDFIGTDDTAWQEFIGTFRSDLGCEER